VNLAQDRDQNGRLLADTEYLTREVASLRISLGDVVTRDYLRAELRAFLDELDEYDDRVERGDRPRDRRTDKPRLDKSRSDKPRTDKSRGDKPRSDKPRADKPRADKPRATADGPRRPAEDAAQQ
jgi:hypothetical protein